MSVVGHLPTNLSSPDSPDSEMPSTIEEALARAVAQNPTLKSATADLDARKEQYEVSKSPYYPIIDLLKSNFNIISTNFNI